MTPEEKAEKYVEGPGNVSSHYEESDSYPFSIDIRLEEFREALKQAYLAGYAEARKDQEAIVKSMSEIYTKQDKNLGDVDFEAGLVFIRKE